MPRPSLKNQLGLRAGLAIVLFIAVAAIFVTFVSPHNPIAQDHAAMLQAPDASHLMGTDLLGRDILSRLAHGARISLMLAVTATILMTVIGMSLGAVAGYFGGVIDALIMRTADVLLAFPFILGAIAIMTVIGPGLENVLFSLVFLGWPQVARIARAQVIDEAAKDYVAAVKVVGGSPWYILRRHLLPNISGPIAVFSLMGVSTVILTEATLSFLGIGVQLPYPSWGSMLADATGRLTVAPWLIYGPGAAIILTCLGFNLLGEGLRDSLDISSRT